MCFCTGRRRHRRCGREWSSGVCSSDGGGRRASPRRGAGEATAVAFEGMSRGVRRGSRGTSLLEVLTASAIMATVLGIGVPRLVMLRAPYALSGAAHQIVGDLELAPQRAIARNKRFPVNFNAPTGS